MLKNTLSLKDGNLKKKTRRKQATPKVVMIATERHTGKPTYRQADQETGMPAGTQTERMDADNTVRDRQTDNLMDRLTN